MLEETASLFCYERVRVRDSASPGPRVRQSASPGLRFIHTRFIRRISIVSNAIKKTIDNVTATIIYCLNCIRRGGNSTYNGPKNNFLISRWGGSDLSFRFRRSDVFW